MPIWQHSPLLRMKISTNSATTDQKKKIERQQALHAENLPRPPQKHIAQAQSKAQKDDVFNYRQALRHQCNKAYARSTAH